MAAADMLFLQSFSLDFAPWASLKKRLSSATWQQLQCMGSGDCKKEENEEGSGTNQLTPGKQEPTGSNVRTTRKGSFNPTMLQIDKLREVFLKYDKDGDGMITNEEFINLLKPGGQQQKQGH